MSNIAQQWPDEPPTKAAENVPGKMIAFAARIDRLAAFAQERLQVGPDPDAVSAALADLAQVRALAGTVSR